MDSSPSTGLAGALKAIGAFVFLLITNVATNLTTGGEAWPTDGGQWARWGLTTVLGTWLVYALPYRGPDAIAPAKRRLPK